MNIATYGTLRKGMPNFDYFKSGLEYLETIELAGFKLLQRGSLPYVVQTGMSKDTVTCDLLFIDTPVYSRRIDAMELHAQYYIDVIMWDGQPYKMYLFDSEKKGSTEIPHGDWVKYAKDNNFYKTKK